MIRLAVAIAAAEAPPGALGVWRGFEASMDKAARLGYDGVELALRDAGEVDAGRIARQLADRGLGCPCISTGQVFAVLGLHLTTPDAARRREVVAVFRDLIDLAAELGAMVNIGRARGFIAEGQTAEDARRRFVDVAGEVAAYARTKNVTRSSRSSM